MSSNVYAAVAGFPYAPSDDFASYYTQSPAPAPYAEVSYPVYVQEEAPMHYNEAPQQGYDAKREASSEEGGDIADADDELLMPQEEQAHDDGVVPPAMLSLPFSVLRVYSNEKDVDEEAEPQEKKKKKKKKKKKVVEEKPDPRLDMNYWLQAPSAAECCIVPIDEDPLPYELLAAM